jgi:hypothetical protein
MADFIDSRAEIGSDEEESDLESETAHRPKPTNGSNNRADLDSSEEEESEDEDAEREVRCSTTLTGKYFADRPSRCERASSLAPMKTTKRMMPPP